MTDASAAPPGRDDAILLCQVRTQRCALPLSNVVETMRPQAIEPIAGAPGFVLGVSRIRGEHLPVVDLGRLLELTDVAAPTRFVLLGYGGRRVALQVESVVGVGALQRAPLRELPSLFGDVTAGPIAALSECDAELLLVLRAARLIPDEFEFERAAGGKE